MKEAQLHQLLCELRTNELLLLVHLPQDLVHRAEQRPAHAQQLVQVQAVMRAAPDVGAGSRQRLAHASHQPAGQRARSLSGAARPAEAAPKQGNQGT